MAACQLLTETEGLCRWILVGVIVCVGGSFSKSAQAGMILSASSFEMSGNLGPANQRSADEPEGSLELRSLIDTTIPQQGGGMGTSGTVPCRSNSPAITPTIIQPLKAIMVARLANHWQLVFPLAPPSDLLRPPRS
jgi:hypothetical protein